MKKRQRKPEAKERSLFDAGPLLPLAELEAITHEVDALLHGMRSSWEVNELRVRTRQSRAAIAACTRDPFAVGLQSALTVKVLELESNALVFRRVERQRLALER
jgi:hypothetical protein